MTVASDIEDQAHPSVPLAPILLAPEPVGPEWVFMYEMA